MSLGAAEGQPGIPGQYANMFIFDQPLHEAEIQLLYQGQANVQATIAPQAEMAVTQATIGPEGGWLRSPDGQGLGRVHAWGGYGSHNRILGGLQSQW